MTADTFSNTLGFLIMGVGNDNNTWGGNCSTAVFQIFEDAIANALTNSVTGGTLDLSGSPPPAAASQARYAALIFSGVLGSAQSVKVPNLQKFWFVQNATSGAFVLTIKTPSGSASTAIPQNSGWQVVYCDGANNIVVHPFNTKQIQMPDGSVSSPAFSYVNEPNSFWYRAGTQDHRLSINGADVLQVTGTGAGTPSIVNVIAPNVLQVAGTQVIPPGMEATYAGIAAPTGWLFEFGQAISRTTFAPLFNALTQTCTGNTHSNTTLDNLSLNPNLQGLIGAIVEGTGIQTGTRIASFINGSSLTLSLPATSSNSNITIRFLPYGQGDGSTTFNVPDRRGRTIFGRDDMGGTPANRLTLATTQGVLGAALAAFGGEQAHTQTIAEMVPHDHGGVTGTATGTLLGNTVAPSLGGNTRIQLSGAAGGDLTDNVANVQLAITAPINSQGSGQAANIIPPGGVSNYIIKT